MGAEITGIGSNRLRIKGKERLQDAVFVPSPDFVDIVGYMIASAITDGEIIIKGGNVLDVMDGIINWMELFNIKIDRTGDDLIVKRGKRGLEISKIGFPLAAPNLP